MSKRDPAVPPGAPHPEAPPAVVIRDFSFEKDFPAVTELWSTAGKGVQLGPSDQAEEIRKKLAYDPDLFLVAEESGSLIGTVLGGFDGRRGLVYHLAVVPRSRQQGIASQLMDELEDRLREKGCLRAYLLVTRDNQDARRFYERRDWEELDLAVYGKTLQ
jgi:ribosomal protein S18 acetylase RimI-like enzyme